MGQRAGESGARRTSVPAGSFCAIHGAKPVPHSPTPRPSTVGRCATVSAGGSFQRADAQHVWRLELPSMARHYPASQPLLCPAPPLPLLSPCPSLPLPSLPLPLPAFPSVLPSPLSSFPCTPPSPALHHPLPPQSIAVAFPCAPAMCVGRGWVSWRDRFCAMDGAKRAYRDVLAACPANSPTPSPSHRSGTRLGSVPLRLPLRLPLPCRCGCSCRCPAVAVAVAPAPPSKKTKPTPHPLPSNPPLTQSHQNHHTP